MVELFSADFSDYIIGSPNAFTREEIEVLVGFPRFFRDCVNSEEGVVRSGLASQPFAGGICLDFMIKGKEAELGFQGTFSEGAVFFDGKDEIDGFTYSVSEIDRHLALQEKPKNFPKRGNCAVYETEFGYILYSVCFPQVFVGSAKDGLCTRFFRGVSVLLLRMYTCEGDLTLRDSIISNLGWDDVGGQIAARYFRESEECQRLIKEREMGRGRAVSTRFGERLYGVGK